MNEKESICEKCENLMKIMTDHDTRTTCLNAGFLSIGAIIKCSHFKAKPKESEVKKGSKSPEKKEQTIEHPKSCACSKCQGKEHEPSKPKAEKSV